MKSLCTRGIFCLSLALLVVGVAACTQNRPPVPTPTLIPLNSDTPVAPSGQPTLGIQAQPTAANGGGATLVPPPTGNETPVPATGETPVNPADQPTPIIVTQPTLLPTPTTVGGTGQTVPTPVTSTDGGQQPGGTTGSCSNPYTVVPGDWLYKIARNCGITYEALVAANPGITFRALRAGQTLNIPGGGSNNNAPPQPTAAGGAAGCPNPYTIQSGDTLNSIARKCGTTASALQRANGIPSPDYIFPGQQIRIP